MADERLSQDEMALVLRRAVELESFEGTDAEEGVSLEALEAGAVAAGVAPESVRRAVAEFRAGMLTGQQTVPERRGFTTARVVPADPATVAESVDRFLTSQLFVKARHRDDVQLWRPREDVVAQVLRGFDWRAAARLKAVDQVAVRLVDADDGTLIRIETTIRRSLTLAPRVLGGGLAVAGLAGGGAALALGAEPLALWSVATGTVTGAGGYTITRNAAARGTARAAEAVEGFLDRLELGDDARRFRRRRPSGAA